MIGFSNLDDSLRASIQIVEIIEREALHMSNCISGIFDAEVTRVNDGDDEVDVV